MTAPRQPVVQRTSPGGRGARERILQAAEQLLATHDIGELEAGDLITAADVSRRSFYQHFSGKRAVHAAYLRRLADTPGLTPLGVLQRLGATPRERIADLFAARRCPPHGCPFSNAIGTIRDPTAASHVVATEFKQGFRSELGRLAREADAADPDALADRLSLIFNGAILETAIFADRRPLQTGRRLALEAFDAAVSDSTR